jgi:hypothetical protein
LKTRKLQAFFFAAAIFLFSGEALGQLYWISAVPSNWNNNANWSTASGGATCNCTPGAADHVVFNNQRVGSVTLDAATSVTGMTISGGYTGTINTNGFILTISGPTNNIFTAGTVGGAGSLVFATGGITTFNGGTFNVPVTGTTGRMIFSGSTFNNIVTLTKTSNANDDGIGGNTFAAAVTLTNNSANRVRFASTNPDTFNGPLTLNVGSTGAFELAETSAAATNFNNDITINYTATGPVRFGNSNGNSILAATRTITIVPGASGTGSLVINRMTLNATQNIALTGNTTASLNVRNSTFLAGATLLAPTVQLIANSFAGPTVLEKTGGTTDNVTGGNTFGGTTNIICSGTGEFNMSATNPDTFNGDTEMNNTNTGRIQLGVNAAGIVVNGNLTINHVGNTTAFNTILAREVTSTATVNGNLILNCANGSTASGIIIANHGTVVVNGNISLSSTSGRGILFADDHPLASVTLAAGFTISDAGPGTFTTGVLSMIRVTQLGNTAQTISTTGNAHMIIGPTTTFNGAVNFTAPRVELDGATFNSSATIEQTGPTDTEGVGNSIFNGATILTNSGSGNFRTSGGNTFNGATTMRLTSSGDLAFEDNSGSTYNGTVEFNNTGNDVIRVATTGATSFNQNIVVNSSSASGIIFCGNAGSSATLAATRTITTTGYTAGTLTLQRFTQTGGTAQALTLGFPGTGTLVLGPSTSFGGNVDFSAPRLFLNGTLFSGTASLEKTGVGEDNGLGGNTFQSTSNITNSGSNYLLTGSVNPDIFNGVLTLTNQSSSTIRLADNSIGNEFNQNIVMNASSGGGIYFGNTGGSSTLANDRTISVGTVLTGDIRLIRMTQVSSVNPQILNLDGIAILTLGPTTQFGGDVDFRAPQLTIQTTTLGTTGANFARLEKEGAGNNNCPGGNIFNGVTTIVNSGSDYLRFANATADVFNANLTLTNTGTDQLQIAYNGAGNQFNGDITFNSTITAQGIYIGLNNGTSTLANGASLLIGPSGFVSGELRLSRFTQIGASAQSLVLSAPPAGTARLRLGPATTFNGVTDFRAPRISLDGCTFNGVAYVEKTGASDDQSSGGNVFNGVSNTLANSGSGWFTNAQTALDTFSGDLTLTNTGSAGIRMADNIPGTIFQGNIVVNSTFGQGIWFCESASGTAQLAATKTVTVGGLGFSSGDLRLRRFTQLSNTAQAITLTGAAGLRLGPTSVFEASSVDFRAPQLYLNGAIYHGTANLEKLGADDNTGTGNNIFMQTTTIRNAGTGNLRTNGNNEFNTVGGTTTLICAGSDDLLLELVTGSIYNGDVTMINSGSSSIRTGYSGTTSFLGNILVNSSSGGGINFGEIATLITLASGRTIAVGSTPGFSAGELRLRRFIQTGTGTPHTLTLTGTASTLRFGNGTTFDSDLTTSSPRLFFDGATFNGTNAFTKTNTNGDDSAGGNTFAGQTTITNAGVGRVRLVSDNFGDITFIRSNSGAFEPAYNGTNTFSGNIITSSSSTITFGTGNGISTFTGTNAQTIGVLGGTAIPRFNRLVMDKPSNTVALNINITIGVSATFTSGVMVSTAINFPNFVNGATVTDASDASFVSGPVRKTGTDAFVFPTGKGGIYRPIALGTRPAAADAFTAEFFNTAQTSGYTMGPGLIRVSGCEYWNLLRTSGTNTATVTLSWRNSDCPNTNVINPSELVVAGYNAATVRWEDRGSNAGLITGTAAEGTITSAAAVSVFGAFALGTSTDNNPLPIELLSFEGEAMGDFVLLNWETASERDNDFFSVQRSGDGVEFASIGTIKGAGTSSELLAYAFHDTSPLNGMVYYRLKQTDFDGKTAYSKVIRIISESSASFVVYPNPVRNGKLFTTHSASYSVFNSVGQKLVTAQGTKEIDVSTLAPGIYLLRSENGETRTFVVE